MNDICEILKNTTNRIYISGHKNPDLDSLCSSSALGLILNTLGKNAKVLIDDKNYEELLYFNCSNFIINKIDNNDEDYTFIAVDLNKKERLPNSVIDIYEKSNYKINIDHHIGDTTNADYICSIEDISSTCEIVYNIAKLCNI